MNDSQANDELDEILTRFDYQQVFSTAATKYEKDKAWINAKREAKASLEAYCTRCCLDELERLQFTINQTRLSMGEPNDLTSDMAIKVRILQLKGEEDANE